MPIELEKQAAYQSTRGAPRKWEVPDRELNVSLGVVGNVAPPFVEGVGKTAIQDNAGFDIVL